jgi:hypothetical protein
MESTEQQQQSSSNIDNIDSNMEIKELPFVDALVTPAPGTNLRGTLTHGLGLTSLTTY